MKLLVLFISVLPFISFGQESLNKRYTIGYDATIFGSVKATDSCYYVLGKGSNASGLQLQEGAWLRFNFDGSIHTQKMYTSDTMEVILWESPNLIETLDSNFATLGTVNTNYSGGSYQMNLLFLKIKPNGDTLFTTYIDDFYTNDNNISINPSAFFQNSDSSYSCIAVVSNLNSIIGKTVFFKLSKAGVLLWYTYFSGLSPTNYRILDSKSLIKYDTNKILIGGSLIHPAVYNEDTRCHTKLIMVDTLGNLLWQRTYWEDTLNFYCSGLTKTTDGGVLYCGRDGAYNVDGLLGLDYKSHITKLDENFDLEWRIKLGVFSGETFSLNNIKAINDTEFVAVGNTHSYFYESQENYDFTENGWLVKFNIAGEIIWERKYVNIPHFDTDNNNYAKHILYDVDMTKDSGFVMVGQARNLVSSNGQGGQQGWLVKVDKHGCLVPNCQQYDNVDTTTTDTTVVQPPEFIPENVLYPNPANTSLYYYHTQTDTMQQQTAYMYNLQGELVQHFNLMDCNITYSIDVSNLASGLYVFKVRSSIGNILRTEKIIIQH